MFNESRIDANGKPKSKKSYNLRRGDLDNDHLISIIMTIRQISHTLLNVKHEHELFQNICDLIRRIDSVSLVWIGLKEEGTYEVKPIAMAGCDESFFRDLKIRWDDSEYGNGPTGTAIKTQTPVVVKDMHADPKIIPWRQHFLGRNLRASIALPVIYEDDVIGVLNVFSSKPEGFEEREIAFLTEVAWDIAVGIRTLRLQKKLEKSYGNLKKVLNDTVSSMSLINEYRDPYTAGHQRRTAQLACSIGREMGLPESMIEGINISALLHDLGKVLVPVEILSKPRKLSYGETILIKGHPQAGFEILKGIEFPWPVAQTVLQHHERMDGSGYPMGLSGKSILLEARIIGVSDVVEAIASHRPYRPALGIGTALDEILNNRGKLYDADVVDACLTLFNSKGFVFFE